MASSGGEFTTLQTIALSFNFKGIVLDAVEVLSPHTAIMKIENLEDRRKEQPTVAYIFTVLSLRNCQCVLFCCALCRAQEINCGYYYMT